MPAYRTIDGIFLGDVEFWKRPIAERHDAFAALREETRRGGGMCFHEEVTVMGGDSAGPGYWSAVTFDDARAVSRNQECFSSASGVISNDPAPEYLAVGSIIVMDDPRHTKLRRLGHAPPHRAPRPAGAPPGQLRDDGAPGRQRTGGGAA